MFTHKISLLRLRRHGRPRSSLSGVRSSLKSGMVTNGAGVLVSSGSVFQRATTAI